MPQSLIWADATEQRLLTILHMVNDWLKFAEMKNTGLVALLGTIVTALISVLAVAPELPLTVLAGMVWLACFLLISLAVAVYSFFPARRPYRDETSAATSETAEQRNIYFYGDLSTFHSAAELVTAAGTGGAEQTEKEMSDNPGLVHLANQIITNSRIAGRKFRLFSYAVLIASVAIVPIPLVIVAQVF